MCGIAGILRFKGSINLNLIKRMNELMSHRGPDDEGYIFGDIKTGNHEIFGFNDTPKGVYESKFPYSPKKELNDQQMIHSNLALSSRRLAILDLSPAGHQPMTNKDRSIWIVHNGEIYNFKEIREELKDLGHKFFSNSDTEVIINAYEEWGHNCLKKFNGMWSFCIWDVKRKKLFCSRDRFGIKPFYYYFGNGIFAFASEIKPLLQLNVEKKPNDSLIYDFLKAGLLDHTEDTFFEGIRKLPPAYYLSINLEGKLDIQKYWDLCVSNEIYPEKNNSNNVEEFFDLFNNAIKLRLRSDVLVGSCLSGGLDSSSIVCLVDHGKKSSSKVMKSVGEKHKTFSACFEDKNIDERKYIKEVIEKTNSERNYVFPEPSGFLREVDILLRRQEEPFGGSSIYAQWCVMREAKKRGVIVLLDGQGGDEQLCGYRKFHIFYFLELMRNRKLLRLFNEFLKFIFSYEILKTSNFVQGARYFKFGNKILGLDHLLLDSFKLEFNNRFIELGYKTNLGERIKEDITKYSLPVLLRYEDKNSMAHSVEARLPFLDYRLVEKISSYPLALKIKNGWTKYILREAMKGYLPEKIRKRKSKIGFSTPENKWFKHFMNKEVKDVFENAAFIPTYLNRNLLIEQFSKYSRNNNIYNSEIFHRFYILELWGRKFIL